MTIVAAFIFPIMLTLISEIFENTDFDSDNFERSVQGIIISLQKNVCVIHTKTALVLKHTYQNMLFNSHNTQYETFHNRFCVACSKPWTQKLC